MKHLLKNMAFGLGLLLIIGLTPGRGAALAQGFQPYDGFAAASKEDSCAALHELDSTKDCGSGSASIGHLIGSIINILSLTVGIAAVIMIIISGFKYVTSGGDSNSISSAKSTLTYALIGLLVASLAQFLVHFVLYSAVSHPCKYNAALTSIDTGCVAPKKK